MTTFYLTVTNKSHPVPEYPIIKIVANLRGAESPIVNVLKEGETYKTAAGEGTYDVGVVDGPDLFTISNSPPGSFEVKYTNNIGGAYVVPFSITTPEVRIRSNHKYLI